MGDLTNILLTILITLIGTIATIGYKKMDAFGGELKAFAQKLETILLNDVATQKDVSQLQKDVEDHEERITTLEKK